MTHARYIGDGVYAQFDGYGIVVTTGSHELSKCDNRVVFDPEVADSFMRYVQDLRERLKVDPNEKPEQI